MGDGDSIAKHLNAFNTIVIQLISFGVKKDEEDHCMTLLCSLSDSRDLVMAIGSIVKNLVLESTNEALVVHEKSKERG